MLTATEQKRILAVVSRLIWADRLTRRLQDAKAITQNQQSPAYRKTRARLIDLLKEVG